MLVNKMTKIFIIIFAALFFLIFVSSNVLGMLNPAEVYCEELGYTYQVNQTADGEEGVCVIKDDLYQCHDSDVEKLNCTLIEQGIKYSAWDFLEGKVGKEYSYCSKIGQNIETVSDGKDPFSEEYAVCVPKTKSEPTYSTSQKSGSEISNTQISGRISVTDAMDLKTKTSRDEELLQETQENFKFAATSSTSTSEEFTASSSPSSLDWRNKNGKNWITSVKSQKCGSCWAYATSAGVEAKYNIVRNTPYFNLNLAEQYLVSTCSDAGDCGGGSHASALEFIKEQGITDEFCFKDVGQNLLCSNRCSDWSKRLWKIDDYEYVDNSPTNIKEALINKGPLPTFIWMDGYFDNGIYRCSNPSDGAHVVLLVGYNDAGRYWIAKNSWGTSFGDGGFFKIGYGECSIESSSYAIDLYPRDSSNKNVASLSFGEGSIDSGSIQDLSTVDYTDITLKEDCGFMGCDGLDAQFKISLTGISRDISSLNLITTYRARWEDNFRVEYWDPSGSWKHLEYLPDSEWYTLKYNICNSKTSCNNFLNSNSNVFVRYYHPSCTWCDTDYVDVDYLTLESEKELTITCNNNIECNDYNSLTRDICYNPGTPNAYCVNNPEDISCFRDLDCGEDVFNGNGYCIGNSIYRDYFGNLCMNPGNIDSYCYSYSSYKWVKGCSYGCSNGECLPACSSNKDCGNKTVNYYCSWKDSCAEIIEPVCMNPGTEVSYCSENYTSSCNYCEGGCSNGECIACSNNFNCKDDDISTIDKCMNPETNLSYCYYVGDYEDPLIISQLPENNSLLSDFINFKVKYTEQNLNSVYLGFYSPEHNLNYLPVQNVSDIFINFAENVTEENVDVINYTETDYFYELTFMLGNDTLTGYMTKDGRYYLGYLINISNAPSNSWVYSLQNLANYIKENSEEEFKISKVIGVGYLDEITVLLGDYNVSVYITPDGMYLTSSALNMKEYLNQETQMAASSQPSENNLFSRSKLNSLNGEEEVFFSGYIQDCSSGQNVFCNFHIDLSDYNYSTISYEFALEDESGKTTFGDKYSLFDESWINCNNDRECDDFNNHTYDTCISPRQLNSYCSYKNISCIVNEDCDDHDNFTIDVCHSAGTYQSYCENIELEPTPELIVNSPTQYLSDTKKIYLNLSVTQPVDKIVYIDNSDSRPKEKSLCTRNCNGYGNDRVKYQSFNDGFHNITFKAIKNNSVVDEETAGFIIDSKKPRISKTEPMRGFASGIFNVEFTEDNPKELILYYGNSIRNKTLDIESECILDRTKYKCQSGVNLSNFDGQKITYWFELKDIIGNTHTSREIKLDVDTTSPVLNNPDSFWKQGEGRYYKYVYFNLNVTEQNFDEISYIDSSDSRLRKTVLCSRLRNGLCEVKKSFRTGEHNLTLSISDDARNSIEKNIDFKIL